MEAIFFDRSSTYDRNTISANMMLNAMFWTRVGQGTLYGEFVLDDFDIDSSSQDRASPLPSIYHLSLGGRYLGVSDRLELGFDYRRVSGWSYRTSSNVPEVWMHLDRGLGAPWSDYDRLTLRADLYPSVQGLRVSPVLQFQRKGRVTTVFPFSQDRLIYPGSSLG